MPSPSNNRTLHTQNQPNSTTDWVLDLGATTHLTSDLSNLQLSAPYQGIDTVSRASGSTLPIFHNGAGILPLPNTSYKLQLNHLLHVLSLTHNLLSISRLTIDNNCSISFDTNGFVIKDLRDNQILLRGHNHDGIYPLHTPHSNSVQALSSRLDDASLWHARLVHPHHRTMTIISKLLPNNCTTTVARSSTEAEYRALAAAASDVLWLRRLMENFQVPQSQPTPIFCDNISTLALTHNPVFHARTKHIEIDHHFISDHIGNHIIDVSHISSVDQLADILTKPLSAIRFSALCDKLTIFSPDRLLSLVKYNQKKFFDVKLKEMKLTDIFGVIEAMKKQVSDSNMPDIGVFFLLFFLSDIGVEGVLLRLIYKENPTSLHAYR
ncbi:hypothetical protein KFK09_007476 [Dendrobium nobile]|uniref:Retrovirus-related Pol polyprotein from transposon RE2 n=1 Tax=Dendrobium nobile TaxID=94219 RepID=A0A8T3BWL5_DENNO|nr:hypothetical protein KFK09_007476 [Dendrobium nobile]